MPRSRPDRRPVVGLSAAPFLALLSMLSVLGLVTSLGVAGAAPAGATTDPSYNWDSPSRLNLGGGWTFGPCPGGGDAPIACVRRNGSARGTVEHLTIPVDSLDVLDGVANPNRAERRLARAIVASLMADRETGCPPDATVASLGVTVRTVARGQGARYGFKVTRDALVVERVVGYVLIRGEWVHLFVANAVGANACLSHEPFDFFPGGLAVFRPRLDAVIATSRVTNPRLTAPANAFWSSGDHHE